MTEQSISPNFELVSPIDGELVDPNDADVLIDSFERIKWQQSQLWVAREVYTHAIIALAQGETKTRRVRGKQRRAKIVMPDPWWDQTILKEAWQAFPHRRDEALAIATLRVKRREYNKMLRESGPPDFEAFRDMIRSAERTPTRLPTIIIEE